MHTLVLYGHSDRAEESLRSTARLAREHGDRLTVLTLAQLEPLVMPVKCDTSRGLWNQILRELAQDELARAYMAVDGDDDVELDVLLCTDFHPADAIAAEALRRRERRRLRRRSPVPVTG